MTGVGWWNADDGVTGTLASREYKDTAPVVVSALTSNMAGAGGGVDDNTAQGGHLVPYVKGKRAASDADDESWRQDQTAPTLNTSDVGDGRATVLAVGTSGDGALAGTLGTRSGGGRTTDIDSVGAYCVTGDRTHALTSEGADASEDGTGRGTPIISVSNDSVPVVGSGYVGALKVGSGLGIPSAPAVLEAAATVRRLTPVECERLQAFPDDWTAERVQQTGKRAGEVVRQADSARYKQMGNAVTVNVVEWVLRRLLEVEAR